MSANFPRGPTPVNPLLGAKERDYLWALVYGHEWDPPRVIPNRNQAKVTKSGLKAKAARLPVTLRTFFDDVAMLSGYFLLDERTGLLRTEIEKFARSAAFLQDFRNFCD